MDGNQITKVCLEDPFINPYFFGVIARDEFPTANIPPLGLFCMNLDKKSEPGSHWVAICLGLTFPGRCVYVDSFARQPPIEVSHSLLKHGWDVVYNDVVIQNSLSQSCGKIVLLFLKLWSHGYSTHEIVHKILFNDDEDDDEEPSSRPYKAEALSENFISEISGIKRGPIVDFSIFSKEK